ncbi:MAG TPA: LysM peptidoglycan-binding domain-containing protein [Ilumatobacter sp.]|jgi:LysM repeat protein|nr:LysM peptidoglycan-binding domain-containing protein [Ilumatobacter sp.]
MHRAVLLPSVVVTLVMLVASACGPSPSGAAETLPPIRTTTSTTTTTTTPDSRRRFYEVKPGDNLAVIARSFDVPPSEIVRINGLADGGETLQIGQVLEIPTDVVMVESLPTEPPSSTSEP